MICPNCAEENIIIRWTAELTSFAPTLPETNDHLIYVMATKQVSQEDYRFVCNDCEYEWRDPQYKFRES